MMYLAAALAILAIPKEKSPWQYIKEHRQCFVWDDFADEVPAWNEMTGKDPGHEDVQVGCDAEYRVSFTYKGNKVRFPLVGGRKDSLISVHALSQLVKADSELRFCLDSWHCCDGAFLALPPREWRRIEAELGREAVDYRFLRIPSDFDEFFKQAFSKENNRSYPSEKPPVTPIDHMIHDIKEQTLAVARPRCECAKVNYFLSGLTRSLKLCVQVDTDLQRDGLKNDHEFVARLHAMAVERCKQDDHYFELVLIQSQETVDRDFGGEWIEVWFKK